MHNKEFGFILKRFLPYKKKLSVLCCQKGKINLITQPTEKCHQLWPGMLICFTPTFNNKKICIAHDIEIIMSPEQENFSNLYWVHHLLEICYYFVPLENPC